MTQLSDEVVGWQPIETAPQSGYIIGAWLDGSHWRVAEVFNDYDEWVDVFSDRIHSPTHWTHRPIADEAKGDIPTLR